MKIHFEKNLQVLLFTLMAIASTLAALSQVKSAWSGVKEVYNEQDFGLRVLRGAMLIALANQHGAEKPVNLDGWISDGGRLVWKTPESSVSACCGIHGSNKQ
jgi:hypothetical protein